MAMLFQNLIPVSVHPARTSCSVTLVASLQPALYKRHRRMERKFEARVLNMVLVLSSASQSSLSFSFISTALKTDSMAAQAGKNSGTEPSEPSNANDAQSSSSAPPPSSQLKQHTQPENSPYPYDPQSQQYYQPGNYYFAYDPQTQQYYQQYFQPMHIEQGHPVDYQQEMSGDTMICRFCAGVCEHHGYSSRAWQLCLLISGISCLLLGPLAIICCALGCVQVFPTRGKKGKKNNIYTYKRYC
jgi:hypothetical protein